MFITVNVNHAPTLLVFTLADWPSIEEQSATRNRLLVDRHLIEGTCALVDFRAVRRVPSQSELARAIDDYHQHQCPGIRIAFIVGTAPQTVIVKEIAARLRTGGAAAFFTEHEALQWLFPGISTFPFKLLA
jgi:hypothetical protein